MLASTNKAVDNVAERVCYLMNHNVGHYQLTGGSHSKLSSPCLIHDAFMAHKDYTDLEQTCDKNYETWEKNTDLTRKETAASKAMYEDICTDIISQANVIYATFTSAQIRKLERRKFQPDVVIIDEAGQAPEALAWFGVLQASKAIIVGDQNQCK